MAQQLFDRAAICLKEQRPFVLYRKPSTTELIGVFQQTDEVHVVQDFTESGFVFAPFDLNSNAILLQMDTLLKGSLNSFDEASLNTDGIIINESVNKPRYLDLITMAIDHINAGYFNKVVLSRKIEATNNEDNLEIYKRLISVYQKAFCYFWYHPKVGAWMGATPEILVKTNGSHFTTMSLAGTKSFIDKEEPNWSEKELDEQQLVTDYILDALKDEVVSIKSSKRESVRAGQLWHLRTEMNGTFAPHKFGSVVRALHPTPAVCGTPLLEAKDFILKNEMYDRSFYTGFLGELNMKSEVARNRNRKNQENNAYRSVMKTSELFVNLRCMQLFKDKVAIYVGGGITGESIPESEWQETALKSNTMLRVLGGK